MGKTFNSQICTTREQSERLLALGLRKETADMTWEFSHTKNGERQYDCRAESSWDSDTFARYVEHCEKIGYFEHWKHDDGSKMTPEEVYEEIMEPHIPAWSLHRLIEMMPMYFKETKIEIRSEAVKMAMKDGNLYDNLIDIIADCIKGGCFNKEYLED